MAMQAAHRMAVIRNSILTDRIWEIFSEISLEICSMAVHPEDTEATVSTAMEMAASTSTTAMVPVQMASDRAVTLADLVRGAASMVVSSVRKVATSMPM